MGHPTKRQHAKWNQRDKLESNGARDCEVEGCANEIALTDVQGHYSGVCAECREGQNLDSQTAGTELRRRRRMKSAGVTDWTRQKGDYMYDEGKKSEFGGNA